MNSSNAHNSLFWDMIAGRYDKQSRKYDETYKRTVQKSLPYLNKKSNIIDVACGTGIISIDLAQHVSSITAIDSSPNMVSICRTKASERNIKNITCKQSDIFSVPSTEYNAVLLMNIIHFIEDTDTFVERAVSLCKKGGYIITATDCLAESSGFAGVFGTGFQKFFSIIGLIPRMHFFTIDELIEYLEEFNLVHVESEVIFPVPPNLFAVFQKK